MKIKLDENFGNRAYQRVRDAGHDVHTVRHEGLGGATDGAIYAACLKEGRCLVTLDLDFSQIYRFPTRPGAGIAVLRSPIANTPQMLALLLDNFLKKIGDEDISGHLWIVEAHRVRIR